MENAVELVAGIYPHLSDMKGFRPDVPVTFRGSAEDADSDEEFDEHAAFDPLADSLAEVAADSERRFSQPSATPKVGITEYNLEPYTVPGFGR